MATKVGGWPWCHHDCRHGVGLWLWSYIWVGVSHNKSKMGGMGMNGNSQIENKGGEEGNMSKGFPLQDYNWSLGNDGRVR